MPTIEKRVSQTVDDGHIYWTGSAWSHLAYDTHIMAGYDDATYYKFSTWQLFRNITIPKGATILAAKLTYVCHYERTGTVCRTKIRAADEDNPSWPPSANDYLARPLTAAVINWDTIPVWTVESPYDSPDFKDVI